MNETWNPSPADWQDRETAVPVESVDLGGPEVRRVTAVQVGDVVLGGPDVPCEVLGIEHGTETVLPLAGRPCIRLDVRRQDTGEEGWLTYGPAGFVRIAS